MARVITDNPGGWSRSLPGHTVEYEASFAQPFYYGGSLVIAASASNTYTLTILDTEHIYFINMLNITPRAYTEFNALISVNDSPYVGAGGVGWLNIPLSQNPSIQLIAGDHVDVLVTNLNASRRAFLVKANGNKIKRPAAYGHAPGAYWTADTHALAAGNDVTFTEASLNTPTSWDWDFGDGSAHSTVQHPVHTYPVAGTYYPLLKATNAYGHDYYAESTPVVVS